MNNSFASTVQQADGRYLSDQELSPLETYSNSFAMRVEAYQTLRDNADSLVMQSLRRLVQTHRQVVQEQGAKCKRDMTYSLSYVARAVLSDEATAFQQDFSLWMENIIYSVQKNEPASQAYGFLKQEIQNTLPPQCVNLVTPYMDELISVFSRR